MTAVFTAHTGKETCGDSNPVLTFGSLGLLLVAACSMVLPEEMTGTPDNAGSTNFMIAVVFTAVGRCATASFGTSILSSGTDPSSPGAYTSGNLDATL